MIPKEIKVKKKELPDAPGVYFYYSSTGELLYVGKATSLKRRVNSYFNKAHDRRIQEMVSQIARIDYIQTPTVIEALVLEANKIKALRPKYNILQRDDKTFLYLVITNEDFPRPLMMRGRDLQQLGINPFAQELSEKAKKRFLRVFGPYISGRSLRTALDLIRKFIPWSTCEPPDEGKRVRPCFDAQIDRCPGVCVGAISKTEYRKYIRQLIAFFEGKKMRIDKQLERAMLKASKEQKYEQAAMYKRRLNALRHIKDVALISRDDYELPLSDIDQPSNIDLDGRIEAYDISNISGTSAVGSMVVFEQRKPKKSDYRKFKIRTVEGSNDVGMMEEVMRRRLRRAELYPKAWPLPELMVVDGGKPQVNRVQAVLDELGFSVPIVGLAKGSDRKQDRLVYDRTNEDLRNVARRGKEVFQKARDEAHRFALKYHRTLRSASTFKNRPKKKKDRR